MKRMLLKQISLVLVFVLLFCLTGAAEDGIATIGNAAHGLAMDGDESIAPDVESAPGELDGLDFPLDPLQDIGGVVSPTMEPVPEEPDDADMAGNAVPEKLTLGVGETYRLRAKRGHFKSSRSSVASVSKEGVITARKKGTAKIAVISGGKKIGTCTVTVVNAPKKVSLGLKSVVLGRKETLALAPAIPDHSHTTFTYKAKDKRIAAVNAKGVITARRVGSTTITVRTHNGKKAKIKVTVERAPTKVAVSPDALSLEPGQSAELAVKLPKKTASYRLTWRSDNNEVASVDENGTVTAVGAGTARITVKTFNRKKAVCTVVVTEPAPSETPAPTETPAPSEEPSPEPAETPTEAPTETPTEAPAETPTEVPAETPTEVPAETPTAAPTEVPQSGTPIDETNFPDENLRALVNGMDSDGDGVLSEAEAASRDALVLTGNNVSSLAGIGVFTGLTTLECENSGLAGVDLSGNTALEQVKLGGNNLSELDITGNAALRVLDVRNNNLTALVLSKNAALSYVDVSGNIGLTELDVSNNPALADCVAKGQRNEENGVVAYTDGNATLIVNSGVEIVTGQLPVIGTITALTLRLGDVVAGEETVVLPDAAVTASWIAEGDVERYSYVVKAPDGTTIASDSGADKTSYEIAADALVAGEEYTLTVDAIPTNGSEIDATTVSARFKREAPDPVPASEFIMANGVVTGYTGEGGAIEIPSVDGEGKAITEIGKEAFKNNMTITSVVISANVTQIGESAFEGCIGLEYVKIPNGVTTIGKAAFKNCNKLSRMDTTD